MLKHNKNITNSIVILAPLLIVIPQKNKKSIYVPDM